jgi:hypothetical protein
MRVLINTIPLLSKTTGVTRYTVNVCRALIKKYADINYTFYYGFPSEKLETITMEVFERTLGQ